MKATLVCLLVFLLLRAPVVLAADHWDGSFQQAVSRAVQSVTQVPAGGGEGNPYRTPALVMIAAGIGVALMGSTMPQLRTQTDDYDLCAAANGGPTGPSTRVPACDSYRTANKGLVWTGAAVAAAGVSVLTISAFKDVTVRVRPGGAFVGKTKRF